jgi:hypothetical protein
LGENSHEEGQAVGMEKLWDMDEEFDGRSSGMRKGVKTLVINRTICSWKSFADAVRFFRNDKI